MRMNDEGDLLPACCHPSSFVVRHSSIKGSSTMLISVFGALAFVGTGLGLVIALVGIVFLLVRRKVGLALAVMKWTAVGLAVYFGVLVLASVTSAETVL